MFGPSLPVYVRSRIYRRRLAIAHGVASVLFLAASLTIEYEPDPYEPDPHVGYLGDPLFVTNIDEQRDEVFEHELLAGGHPVPSALEAVELELELTHQAPDLSVEEHVGNEESDAPLVEEPRPGPVAEDNPADRDAAPLSVRSNEIVVLKFVKPPYPTDAKLMGIEGLVMVTVAVGTDGAVTDAVARADEGILPSCIEVALLAAQKWRFRPRRRGGAPEPFEVAIPFRFTIEGEVKAGI